jgi:hypothetical protein
LKKEIRRRLLEKGDQEKTPLKKEVRRRLP